MSRQFQKKTVVIPHANTRLILGSKNNETLRWVSQKAVTIFLLILDQNWSTMYVSSKKGMNHENELFPASQRIPSQEQQNTPTWGMGESRYEDKRRLYAYCLRHVLPPHRQCWPGSA